MSGKPCSLIGMPWPQATTFGRNSARFLHRTTRRIPIDVERRAGPRQLLFPPINPVHESMSIVASASPASRTRSDERKNETCPGEWPGVAVQRHPSNPGKSSSGNSRTCSPRCASSRGHEAREECDRPTDRRVGRRISRASRHVRKLQPVRINRHVPFFGQLSRRSAVIEMPVRKIDRRWPRACSEARFRRFENVSGPARQSGIDQRPGFARMADKIRVHKTDRQPADVGSDAFDSFHEKEACFNKTDAPPAAAVSEGKFAALAVDSSLREAERKLAPKK